MEKPCFHSLSASRGEFNEPPSSSTFGYEPCPYIITTIRNLSFSGLDSESPYHHLYEFEHLCSGLATASMTRDTLKWKLFPYSLAGKAKQWYTHTVGNMNNNWDELKGNFCLEFFHLSHFMAQKRDIRCFQQREGTHRRGMV